VAVAPQDVALGAGLAQPRHAELQPIVRRACERHGSPHRVLGSGDALARELAVVLRTSKPVVGPQAQARATKAGG
jgi:hypothetical protein